jgi:hypothetical protein
VCLHAVITSMHFSSIKVLIAYSLTKVCRSHRPVNHAELHRRAEDEEGRQEPVHAQGLLAGDGLEEVGEHSRAESTARHIRWQGRRHWEGGTRIKATTALVTFLTLDLGGAIEVM